MNAWMDIHHVLFSYLNVSNGGTGGDLSFWTKCITNIPIIDTNFVNI
jgi:hypothetical protein